MLGQDERSVFNLNLRNITQGILAGMLDSIVFQLLK